VDWATAELLRAFDAAGVESILIKGASVVRWLYDPGERRPYSDFDLLVPPTDVVAARNVLTRLGFQPALDESDMPTWWREHAVGWLHLGRGAVVDLHQGLPGVGVDGDTLWRTLTARSETILIAGFAARTLNISGRALLLALHAAHHGAGFGRVLDDLEQALGRADLETWRQAADLAASLDATAAFATGLRLVPRGRKLADELDLPTDRPVALVLKVTSPPPVALGFEQLARARGLRAKLRILRHKVVPPPTFMRHWSPRARQSRLGLVLAYAWRPIWLLRSAPAGFKAWRAARRASSAG